MAYKCIRGVVTSKGVIAPGDVVDLSGAEARDLMAAGKVVPHDSSDEIITNTIEDVVHRDPVNRRGRKPKNYVA